MHVSQPSVTLEPVPGGVGSWLVVQARLGVYSACMPHVAGSLSFLLPYRTLEFNTLMKGKHFGWLMGL